jgi:predicted TIM-barrel fold metal-dependent hydrolase
MFISDAQIHIWGPNTAERPWPRGGPRTHRFPPLHADEVLEQMARAGVDRTVLVPPSSEGDYNDVVLAAAREHPTRFAVMGRLNLDAPEVADLSRWREQPGMLGVRVSVHDRALSSADWLFRAAAEAQLPVMVMAPRQHEAIAAVAQRHRELRIIVDHLNLVTTSMTADTSRPIPGDLGESIEPLLPLAAFDNVAVKLSALPCMVDEAFPFPTLTPHVRRVVDAFGAERCMWGSDLSRLPCTYSEWVDAMAAGLGCLSPAEVEQIMGRTLASWLDWPEPEQARG